MEDDFYFKSLLIFSHRSSTNYEASPNASFLKVKAY